MFLIARAAVWLVALILAPFANSSPAVNGVLTYGAGPKFETVVYEPRLLGVLPTVGKEPFLVFSGLGCSECDINRSIYIHSPSDSAMESGEIGARYSHPGNYYDPESGELVETVRMFVGRCITAKEASVVWFSNAKHADGRWRKSTFIAKVEGQTLAAGFNESRAITLDVVLRAASNRVCREVPGKKFSLEP